MKKANPFVESHFQRARSRATRHDPENFTHSYQIHDSWILGLGDLPESGKIPEEGDSGLQRLFPINLRQSSCRGPFQGVLDLHFGDGPLLLHSSDEISRALQPATPPRENANFGESATLRCESAIVQNERSLSKLHQRAPLIGGPRGRNTK